MNVKTTVRSTNMGISYINFMINTRTNLQDEISTSLMSKDANALPCVPNLKKVVGCAKDD